MSSYSKKLFEKTITVWQPFSSSVLSQEDTREMTENIIGLFSLLSEWENIDVDKNEKNKEENEGD